MITLSCPAKINLFLAIHGRNPDPSGYHEIETVLARLPQIQDFLHIEPAEEFSFECEWNGFDPGKEYTDEKNTVPRAIRLLEEESGRKFLYHIRLEKQTPPMSGLGGGASDAASIMLYLNEREGLGLPHKRLMELGAKIGMDLPFFISGHPVALAHHYGEKISPLPALPPELKIELHHSTAQNSTKEAYAAWDKSPAQQSATSENLIKAIHAKDAMRIIAALHNDFETIYSKPLAVQPSCHPASYAALLAGSGASIAVFYVSDKKNTNTPN